MTGAGGSEKSVSWLYDYEEQEGEVDFLTRVAMFTFYSGSPGIPVTIGEVIGGTPSTLIVGAAFQSLDKFTFLRLSYFTFHLIYVYT